MTGIIITINNFDPVNITESSLVLADTAAAATKVTVKDIDGFTANEYIVIGRRGEEQSEIRKISSISGVELTLSSALTYAHKKDEEIVEVFGDQIKIKSAANISGVVPADSSFTDLATINVQADQLQTDYNATAGSSSYWYKYTYYNSFTLVESPIAESESAFRGGLVNYVSLDEIRSETGFSNNTKITDLMIRTRREQAESEILGVLATANYNLPLSSIPKLISNISRVLSAGYVLWQDYGALDEGTNKEAKQKIDWAQKMLDKIRNSEIILVGVDGQTLVTSTSGVKFWPDDTTKDETEDGKAGGDYKFESLKEF